MNCERKRTAKFQKVLKNELARKNNFKIVNMEADSNVVCTLVASSSVTGEENSSRQVSVSVINFLAIIKLGLH